MNGADMLSKVYQSAARSGSATVISSSASVVQVRIPQSRSAVMCCCHASFRKWMDAGSPTKFTIGSLKQQ